MSEREAPLGKRATFLAIAVGSYLVVTAWIVVTAVRLNDGALVYALDDAYIHLTVARNLALHGTYGVSPGTYESASSSPLWTLLLAGLVRVVPSSVDWLPLVLNVAACLWLLDSFAAQQHFLTPRRRRPDTWLTVALLPIALFLPALTSTGMEHTLHAAVTVAIVVLLGRLTAEGLSIRGSWAYYVLISAAPMIRFEALFLVVGCAVALLALRMPAAAALTFAAAAWPVAIGGAVNHLHGQYLFPNSVVAKSRFGLLHLLDWVPSRRELLDGVQQDVMLDALLVILGACFLWSSWRRNRRHAAICGAYLIAALLHLSFASVGWFDRYQAYLLIAGTFVILFIGGEVIGPRHHRAASYVLLLALIVLPWGKWRLTGLAPLACHNIYKQQYQMGRFLSEYYRGRTVMVNDLGLVSLFHGGPLVDLWGLGSHDVLEARKSGRFFDSAYVQSLATDRRVVVAAFYEFVLGPSLPRSWIKVATWGLGATWWGFGSTRWSLGIPPAWPQVAFYTPSPAAADELARNLRAFEPSLPVGVRVQYFH